MAPPEKKSNTAPILTLVGVEILSLMAFVGICEARANDNALCSRAAGPWRCSPSPWRGSLIPLTSWHRGFRARGCRWDQALRVEPHCHPCSSETNTVSPGLSAEQPQKTTRATDFCVGQVRPPLVLCDATYSPELLAAVYQGLARALRFRGQQGLIR
jgi:hypothetical protein